MDHPMPDEPDYTKLTYEEVVRFISFFSGKTLAALAKGPLPDEAGTARVDNCRVCAVLEPMTQSGPANVLMEWHDFVSKSFHLLSDIIHGENSEKIEEALIDDMMALVGAASYARCCVIYATANAELQRRRANNAIAAAEPPDERDALEVEADGRAEDAERRLDAKRAGDL